MKSEELAQEVRCHADIGYRILAHFTLNGQEAIEADLAQRIQVFLEGHAARAQRHLDEGLVRYRLLRGDHMIDDFGVAIQQLAAILGMGVYDVLFQPSQGLRGPY